MCTYVYNLLRRVIVDTAAILWAHIVSLCVRVCMYVRESEWTKEGEREQERHADGAWDSARWHGNDIRYGNDISL